MPELPDFEDHPYVQWRSRQFPDQPFAVLDAREVAAAQVADKEDGSNRAPKLLRAEAREQAGIDVRIVVTMVVEEEGWPPLLIAEGTRGDEPEAVLLHVHPDDAPPTGSMFVAVRPSDVASAAEMMESWATAHVGRWDALPGLYAEAAAILAENPSTRSVQIGTAVNGKWVLWGMTTEPPLLPPEPPPHGAKIIPFPGSGGNGSAG